MVEARFTVGSVKTFAGGTAQVEMHAIYDDGGTKGPDDEVFWQATPQGKIEISITNPLAAEQLQAGQRYKVTFEKVEPGE